MKTNQSIYNSCLLVPRKLKKKTTQKEINMLQWFAFVQELSEEKS